jgi:hypothetical protein
MGHRQREIKARSRWWRVHKRWGRDAFEFFLPYGLGLHCADELIDIGVSCADGAEGDDLSAVLFGDIGHRKGIFVDIQSDVKRAKLAHG